MIENNNTKKYRGCFYRNRTSQENLATNPYWLNDGRTFKNKYKEKFKEKYSSQKLRLDCMQKKTRI